MRQVPALDIRRYEDDRDAFVDELGATCREFGFCCISGHGILAKLIDSAYAVFQQFFALPIDTRSLSGFGRPGCESVCAVHIPAAAWPIEPLWAGESSEICPRTAEFSPRPPKSDRLLG